MNLKTYDQLFLLSINPGTHKIYLGVRTALDYGIAGALLYELMKEGIVNIEENELKLSDKKAENETLKRTVKIIEKYNHTSIRKNTSKIASKLNGIKNALIDHLEERNIIEMKKGSILGIFQNNKYKIRNKHLLDPVKATIHEIISNDLKGTNDQIMLINLIEACNLSGKIFLKKADRKKFKKWIQSHKN